MATAAQPEGRSARKRRAILEAATAAFLDGGYLGTSMDEIAAAAEVSKQTVYKHFADKQALFGEIVTAAVDSAGDPLRVHVAALAESTDLERDLGRLARRQLAAVLRPELMQLRRLVIGEAGRFPELGRTFYERGAGRTVEALAEALEALAARGELELDDPRLAASQFNWLIMSAPINRAMLLGEQGGLPSAELERQIDAGVRTFLAAYGRG